MTKIVVLLNVAPCSLVHMFQRLRGTFLLSWDLRYPWHWWRRILSCYMWHRLVWYIWAEVLEILSAFAIRALLKRQYVYTSLCIVTFKKYDKFLYIKPLRTHGICFIQGLSPYRAVNTFHHGYKNQSVNDIQGESYCLFRDPYKTHKYSVITMRNVLMFNLVVCIVTGRL